MDAARACLEEVGQNGASVEMIGRRAGVSEATVYKYFRTKHELLGAVIEAWMVPVIEELRVDVEATSSIEARLFVLARRHLAEMQRNPRIHEVVYRELRWADYRGSAFHRYNQLYAGIFRSIFEAAIQKGELAADLDIALCRDLFYGGLEHLGQRTFFAGRSVDLDQMARTYSQILLRGWLPGSDKPSHAERIERAVVALERLAASSRVAANSA
ncbi:helix-turn-helix transcriptional regulator [Tianweitania sediminis]|uniref:Helix-turn-helix transcriptional regulator n=1 Tax=Tianweitania sediminis TaxID=1502156 RepID=A0A8J7R3L9_9HYPH|nr:helix-turn-helix transcriptional regulator [Tianweitania sediminis]